MSRLAALACFLAATPAAHAQPKTTCVEPGEQGSKVRIETDGGTPARTTLCFGTDCYAYAPNAKPAKLAKSGGPRLYKPVVEVRNDAVCTGQKCDKLGPNLVAAIAAQRKDNEGCSRCDPRPGPIMLDATTDHAVVTIANGRGAPAWNVAADKPISFTEPTGHGHARQAFVAPVGTVLAVDWYFCSKMSTADFCEVDEKAGITLANATGKDVGGAVKPDFSTIYAMTGDRYVLASGDSGTFQLVENGAFGPSFAVAWKYPFYQQIAQVDDDRIALMAGTDSGYKLVEITAAAKSLARKDLATFPLCQP